MLVEAGANKVSVIKAVREITGLGLKEAKDMSDLISMGKSVKIEVEPVNRTKALIALRDAGFYV